MDRRFELDTLLEEIKKYLERIPKNTKKYRFKDLKRIFCSNGKCKASELQNALELLEIEGYIFHDRVRDLYRIFPNELGYVQGNIKINKHAEGFITLPNGSKYKVHPNDLNGALDDDVVVLRPTRKMEQGHVVCTVEKVVKRTTGLVVVEVASKNGSFYLHPFNAHFTTPIQVKDNIMKPLVEGDRILVRIDDVASTNGYYSAQFVKHIGHKDDPDAEFKMIAIDNKLPIEFSEEAKKEADAIPTVVSKEERKGRKDYRDMRTFSIDGAKTKDRDDALTVKQLGNGNYMVIVQIADVSHYIHPGMKLWEEAMSRSTSVYMVDTVIPMIPHKLSNGICSLNPGEDRLTLSCELEITPDGEVVSYDFIDGVIRSDKAMTYDEVNEILEEDHIPEGYEEYVDDLQILHMLSKKLEKKKIQRGYVDFGSNDLEIEVDENKKPVQFKPRVQRSAEKLIENFMLLAGTAAANYLAIPTPYRVHEAPDEDRVDEAFETLRKSGIKVKETHDIINGKVIQQILSQIKDADDRDVAATILLRSMKRASYSVDNVGHFGLGLLEYAQFTSPIRRASDLRIHHNIKLQRDHKFNYAKTDEYEEEMAQFANHATLVERRADQAERDANKVEMVRYMAEHIGEKFEVIVTYVNSQGIYVKTPDGIEGKVNPSDLDGDRFYYDERTMSYKGKKSKLKIKIGSRIILTAVDTKREWKIVNFGLEQEDFKVLKKTCA